VTDHIATEEDRIRQTERARLSALVSGDVAAAEVYHAADFQLVTPIGAVLSRDHYLGAIASGHIKYLTWEPEEIAVRLYGPAAVIRYRARLAVVFGGHHVPLSGYFAYRQLRISRRSLGCRLVAGDCHQSRQCRITRTVKGNEAVG
jgi:hypothetical protein